MVFYEDVSNMFVDHGKDMRNLMQQMIEESLAMPFKNLNISSHSPTAHVNQHASNSSATHVPLKNLQFGMSLNYLPSQAPSARNIFLERQKMESAMVLSSPVVEPINSFPSLASSDQTNELATLLVIPMIETTLW
jgi:hypothetical protein